MKTRTIASVPALVPAAQYVRMSDEAQEYSIDNQKAAIQEYAARHGFIIVKTYADAGKSGVIARNRTSLRQLLKDVVNGEAKYKAILVYDVSRWGRFPNSDEAAHYEFLCASSGVPLHYCAEQFLNDGTATSTLLKALKRSMAAEFSRELGEKVFRGKSRLVQMGYWVGGKAGYGYRRLMVSKEGKPKQILNYGERKSLTTDRVILVPGTPDEIACIRQIFAMVLGGLGCMAIARHLNQKGIKLYGRRWTNVDVSHIVRNPKYAGWNVWHRGTQRLRGRRYPVKPKDWITKPEAFAATVDQETFDCAQTMLRERADDLLWSDKEILTRLRRLLMAKGRLSEGLILKARGMPCPNTLHRHFGSFRQVYEAVGYHLAEEDIFRTEQCERSMRLRRALVSRIRGLFPSNVVVTHLPKRSRSILRVDDSFMVSVLLCGVRKNGVTPHWVIQPNPAEREYVTLVCKMSPSHNRIIAYYLFPHMEMFRSHRSYKNDLWLRHATRLNCLSEFYGAVTKLRTLHSSNAQL